MKAYTDLEQSKKLAEILPLESADMEYLAIKENGKLIGCVPFVKDDSEVEDSAYNHTYDRIACWSLASLLNYLKNKNKFPEIKELSDGRFKLTTYIWDDKDCIQVSIGDSIVDACYEMILKLHELKML